MATKVATTTDVQISKLTQAYRKQLERLGTDAEIRDKLRAFRANLHKQCGGRTFDDTAAVLRECSGNGRLNPFQVHERLVDGLTVPTREGRVPAVVFTRELLRVIEVNAAMVFGAQTRLEARAALLAVAEVFGFAVRLDTVLRAQTTIDAWVEQIRAMLS